MEEVDWSKSSRRKKNEIKNSLKKSLFVYIYFLKGQRVSIC